MTGTKCRGKCDKHDNTIRSYLDGQFKRCTTCDIFLISVYKRCFCCNSQLREKPKSPKDKKTVKGNKAFYKYDALMIRAKNEFRLISKIPNETEKIRKTVIAYLYQAATQIEIIDKEKRLRSVYLKAKVKSFFDFTHKIRLTLN